MSGETLTLIGVLITAFGSLAGILITIRSKNKTDGYDQVQEDLQAERVNREKLEKRIEALEELMRASNDREARLIGENRELRIELNEAKVKIAKLERDGA